MAKQSIFQTDKKAKDALNMIKNLVKTNMKSLSGKDFKTGNMLFFRYDAKDKDRVYDKTPLAMILWRTKTHTLAINLHWAPIGMRKTLLRYIFKKNRQNIKDNKPIEITYKELKPFLAKIGFLPVIRLYINKRIGRRGLVIPPELMEKAAETRSANFTGKPEYYLYSKALKRKKLKRK